MKNKWILSLLAVLLMTAMLLPLASCGMIEKVGAEGDPVQKPANAEPLNQPEEAPVEIEEKEPETTWQVIYYEWSPGDPIPHSEAMLALKEKWETSDEEWTKKVGASVFRTYYAGEPVRKEDKYQVNISCSDEETLKRIKEMGEEIGAEYRGSTTDVEFCTDKTIFLLVTAEQIEFLAKNVEGNFLIQGELLMCG